MVSTSVGAQYGITNRSWAHKNQNYEECFRKVRWSLSGRKFCEKCHKSRLWLVSSGICGTTTLQWCIAQISSERPISVCLCFVLKCWHQSWQLAAAVNHGTIYVYLCTLCSCLCSLHGPKSLTFYFLLLFSVINRSTFTQCKVPTQTNSTDT